MRGDVVVFLGVLWCVWRCSEMKYELRHLRKFYNALEHFRNDLRNHSGEKVELDGIGSVWERQGDKVQRLGNMVLLNFIS